MATNVSIIIRQGEHVARIVKAIGVPMPARRNIPNASEYHQMEVLGVIADATDPPPLKNIRGVPFDLAAATTPGDPGYIGTGEQTPNAADAPQEVVSA